MGAGRGTPTAANRCRQHRARPAGSPCRCGAAADPNRDDTELVTAEWIASEPPFDMADQLIRPRTTVKYSKGDQRLRHDGESYASAHLGPARARRPCRVG